MEKRDRNLVLVLGLFAVACGIFFDLDYSRIAESGLTLSSIVLAVYIAAIIGLINSDLSKKMQKAVACSQRDRTQLGVLTTYFKLAVFCSVGTIFISSIILLVVVPENPCAFFLYAWRTLSVLGLLFYVENVTFLVMIIRFMLNRQIWNS
ncbi:MAG: hypothetical protein PHY23_03720 [Oscillospiraceae bacterium]|jgi:hypothetical protein|nr:hypothetical protein [Oscillospiraceae bacterium]